MSLDVTIKYKKPKRVDYNATHAVCGSTYAICNDGEAFEATEWSANITHNMTVMARHVPVSVKTETKFTKERCMTMYGILRNRRVFLQP